MDLCFASPAQEERRKENSRKYTKQHKAHNSTQ